MFGELDGKSPHTTGAGLDEDLLTGHQLAYLYQRLPGGQPHQRDGGGFFHADVFGL